MAKGCIAYRNRIDAGTLSAGSAALPASLLQNPHVVQAWRSLAGVTSTYLLADLGSAVPLGGVALFGTNFSAAATVRIRVSSSDPTGATGDVYDSGTVSAGVDPLYGALIKFFVQVSGRYLRLDLSDASLPYLQAGRWWAGEVWSLTRNFAYGWTEILDDTSTPTETESGQTWVEIGVRRKGLKVTLPALTRTERDTKLQELWLYAGTRNDVLFCRDPASANLGRDSIWGLVQGRHEASQNAYDSFSLSLTVMERK